MRITLAKYILFPALLISAFLFYAAAFAQTPGSILIRPDSIIYHAKAGDTLMSIASAYTTKTANWVALGNHNSIGRDKHIPIGTPVSIPADLLRDEPGEGKVLARNGAISASYPDGTAVTLAIGHRIVEGMHIRTGANSFLTIELQDKSRVSIPSNSNVRLTTLRKTLYTGSPRIEIALQNGRVVSRVSPLEGNKGSFKIRTPLSVAGVRGTEFRVRMGEHNVATEVLEGRVMASLPHESSPLGLVRAKGNLTSNATLGPAHDLLPPPQLADAPYRQDGAAHFAMKPLRNAVDYHIQLSHDADMIDLIAEGNGSASDILMPGIPEGSYFARLSAIDARGLEGMPRTVAVSIRARPASTGKYVPSPPPVLVDSNQNELVLRWAGSASDRYHVQLARDGDFSWLTYNASVSGTEVRFPRPPFGTYFARVQSLNPDGSGNPFSSTQTLIVTDQWIIHEGQPLPPSTSRSSSR